MNEYKRPSTRLHLQDIPITQTDDKLSSLLVSHDSLRIIKLFSMDCGLRNVDGGLEETAITEIRLYDDVYILDELVKEGYR